MGKKWNRKHNKHAYRSGLEDRVSTELSEKNINFSYESEKLTYSVPAKDHKYTPDFVLTKKDGSKLYIETKGYWPAADRKKMEYIRISNPTLDIRILFSNPNNKITKSSKTTYYMAAEKMGYLWADSREGIPAAWLNA